MNRYLGLILILGGFAMCQAPNSNTSSQPTDSKKSFGNAITTFKTYCSSCHGDNAEVFVDRQWKHGNTKTEIVKSITEGYPDNGMPTWGQALKPQEISDLADYIVNAIERGKQFEFKDRPVSNIFEYEGIKVRLDTMAFGIKNPWGITFLPNGDMIFTDRDGGLYKVDKTTKVKTPITGVPKVVAQGQGGLLDVELHPEFEKNQYIYLSYSKGKDSTGGLWSTTAVMRAKLAGNVLTEAKDIFVAQPYLKTRHHYGSRLEFDKHGYLYVSVGDRGQHQPLFPQKLDNDCGKMHRILDDGGIPADNPFVKTEGAHASIWSYGHRNPQGIALNPANNILWESEHGPRGGDEINIPEKGKNYGWPSISYGINYDGTILTPLTKKDGMEQPLHYWVPSIGPSGMLFVNSDRYKDWKGQVLVGSLRFKYLNLCKLQGNKVVKEEVLFKNIGRLRAVEMDRDGFLYIAVEEPGFIYKVVPL